MSPMVMDTSAMLVGLRPRGPSVPLKMTSAISEPRNCLADCSPSTQRTASEILLFPQPLGPTTAVMPFSKFSVVLSANDLNPIAFRLFRYIKTSLLRRCRLPIYSRLCVADMKTLVAGMGFATQNCPQLSRIACASVLTISTSSVGSSTLASPPQPRIHFRKSMR